MVDQNLRERRGIESPFRSIVFLLCDSTILGFKHRLEYFKTILIIKYKIIKEIRMAN